MLQYILGTFVIPVALFYLGKALWRFYVLRSAHDPSTNLSHLPLPPGDFGLPIVGETFIWAIQGSQFNVIRRRKYGKIFSTNYIGKTMVKVTGPEHIKQILTASYDDIATIWPTSVRRVIGESSIANSVGAVHKYRRKVFLKAFTHAALNSYIPQVHKVVKDRIQSWLNSTDPVLIYPRIKEITFEVAFRVLVGLSFKDEEERKELFETFDTMVTNLFSFPYEFPGSSFSKALKAKTVIHDLLDQHLREKREKVRQSMNRGEYAAESSNQSLKNAMHYVLEAEFAEQDRKLHNGQKVNVEDDEAEDRSHHVTENSVEDEECSLSDVELKETTVEMLFAGYQTVASSGTSAVINLIQNPVVWSKIEDELRQFGLLPDEVKGVGNGVELKNRNTNKLILAEKISTNAEFCPGSTNNNNNCNDPDMICDPKDSFSERSKTLPGSPEITLETLSKMQYLEQVMKETLRVMPPVLGGYRRAQKTFQLGKYRVPKGWTIIYNIRDNHESEWSEDKKFDPDRFSPEVWKDNRESRFRWIPFGGGSRICVGKEFARIQFKLLLIELVRTFRKIEFAKGKPPRMFAIPLLHPTDNLPAKLTTRETKEDCLAQESKKIM